MATLHVTLKAGEASPSGNYEKLTTSGSNVVGTKVSEANGGTVEFIADAAHVVSIGVAPNALTDTGRFAIPGDGSRVCIKGVAKGMKVAAVTA
jgi:hypothetical protein